MNVDGYIVDVQDAMENGWNKYMNIKLKTFAPSD